MVLRDARKLRAGTIAGYLSVSTTVRNVATNTKLALVPELSAIIRVFKQADMRRRFRPPAWDLNLVLTDLTKFPYEPMSQANIDLLTRKTAFLLSFATAARVSELHALDVTQIRFDRGDCGAVHLGLMVDFVAKNQRPGQPARTFTIQSLKSILGPDDTEDRSLCPVRALRRYLSVTDLYRSGRKRLFLSCRPEHKKDISRNTLALWLKATILQAYTSARLPPPQSDRQHEIRALAATMSLHYNIPLKEILEGCFGANDSTLPLTISEMYQTRM